MADAAAQLAQLYAAGFEVQTFERLPGVVGVSRGGCIALFQAEPGGLRMLGSPGWRMGDVLGVLTTVNGRQVFQAKAELLEATPERKAELEGFTAQVRSLLAA